MFDLPLFQRIAICKLAGALVVILGAIGFAGFYTQVGWDVFLGVLIYYLSLGAFVGMCGIITQMPFGMRYSWWWRGPSICVFPTIGLVLMFFEPLAIMFETYAGGVSLFTSPWMYVVEAAVLGLVADYLGTRFVGEGPKLLDKA